MYQQREPEAASFEIVGPWDPEIVPETGEPIRLGATGRDRYAVIDEMIEDVVRLAVSPWPDVDVRGRLRFPVGEDSVDVAFERGRLEPIVDGQRQATGQLVRPLRVGDAFFVRGFDATEPERWQVVDITKVGRDAARKAVLRAISQTTAPEGDQGAARDLSWRQPPEEPEPTAGPAGRVPPSSANPAV